MGEKFKLGYIQKITPKQCKRNTHNFRDLHHTYIFNDPYEV